MKVLYLINKVSQPIIQNMNEGKGHDSGLFGMFRLRKYDIDTDLLEIEQFIPKKIAGFLRRNILTMHYAHLPLFLLFFRYDIVFTSTAYASLILKAVLRIKKFKWVVLDFNVLGTIGSERKIREKIYAWAVSKADGAVCISEAAAMAMKKRFPHLAKNVIFLREATDIAYFKPGDPSEEENEIISVGNFGRDFITVIEATKDLGIKLNLATKLIPPARMLTNGGDLPSHVTVKLYSHQEMLRAYRRAKIAVVGIALKDDYYDSVGTFALGEALSMGKATIVTHTKNMESYVKNGQNGFFVPYKDVAAMRTKITELLNNDGLRHRIGSNARSFALEYLDSERFAEQLANYFKQL